MIVVDTSVWIDASRRPAHRNAAAFNTLLDADDVALALPVRLELSAGVSKRDRPRLMRGLSSLPVVRPTEDTWNLIERWIPAAANKGYHFGLADLLIAALTQEIGGLVWSLDRDFEEMERLKMVSRYESSD